MADQPSPEPEAVQAAEEVLQVIFGEDLHGCAVSLDEVAGLIQTRLQRAAWNHDLFELAEKVLEAVALLSTPPEPGKLKDPEELQALLSDRLDTIHKVTAKAMDTIARARIERGFPPADEGEATA